jgi:hypothetical protein
MADRVRLKTGAVSSKRRVKKRICLRCDRGFLSEGPYNRLCQSCREYLNASPTPEEDYSVGYL